MHSFNLLPWRKQQRQRQRYRCYAAGVGCIGFCIAITIAIRVSLLAQITKLQQDFQKLTEITTRLSDIKIMALQKAWHRRQVMWVDMNAIINAIPSDCYLTTISQNKSHWHLKGMAINANETDAFMAALRKTHRFRRVTLKNVTKKQNIHFVVDYDGKN